MTVQDACAGGGFELQTPTGRIAARTVIIATPAFKAAALLHSVDRLCSELLGAIPYVSVASVALAYPRRSLHPTGTAGFVVPPSEGGLVTAVTWVSEKWPRLASDDVALVRCSVGHARDQRWRALGDDLLIDRVRADLARLAGVRAEPLAARVSRWEDALPQYAPGLGSRVAEVEARLAGHPGLLIAGAAYRGIGIPSCIAQAESAAVAAARQLRSSR